MKRKTTMLLAPVVLSLLMFGCPNKVATTLIDYPISLGSSADMLSRAFYITSYPGTSLSRVTLYFCATSTEAYQVLLEAMDSTFDGTPIGQASATFSGSTGTSDFKATTFDFGDEAVTKNHVVAFKLSLVSGGSGTPYFCNHGDSTGTYLVQETEDSTPPLSVDRWSWAMPIKVEGLE